MRDPDADMVDLLEEHLPSGCAGFLFGAFLFAAIAVVFVAGGF